ncbi:MAG: hypothetical protein JRD04_10820, partial [Deltaproteobacteria bacterium]|nr:hypothetical protein [Deltaproteobacteria bacterium]
RYDAVILDLPEPDTFQINRFYTDEFFAMAKHVLKKNGILTLNMDYSPNYLSDLRKRKLSILYHTLERHFKHILVLPGEQACFLVSDRSLSDEIPRKLTSKGINTAYIDGYFHGNITEERILNLREKLGQNKTINTDFTPRLMQLVFREWFTRHGDMPTGFVWVLAGGLLLYFIFMKKEEYVLFSTGFTIMGLEMAIIFAFQIIYGYVYVMIGAIITAFLLGASSGRHGGRKMGCRKRCEGGIVGRGIAGYVSGFFMLVRVVQGCASPSLVFDLLLWCLIFCRVSVSRSDPIDRRREKSRRRVPGGGFVRRGGGSTGGGNPLNSAVGRGDGGMGVDTGESLKRSVVTVQPTGWIRTSKHSKNKNLGE